MNGKQPLVLSLFPGIGLLDMAFEEAGFCVVRGPDLLWGGDVRRFHPPSGKFKGVIGGPPCQQFSKLGVMARNRGQNVGVNLIPEFERCVAEAHPNWFVMENVVEAPLPAVDRYEVADLVLCNREVGGAQRRRRRFSWGLEESFCIPRMTIDSGKLTRHEKPSRARLRIDRVALEHIDVIPTITANGAVWNPEKKQSQGDHSPAFLKRAIDAQGLPADFDLPPFLLREKIRAVGNGVPLPMGRAVAAAVRRAMYPEWQQTEAAPTVALAAPTRGPLTP